MSCHVTATTCELQRCRSSNVPKTRVFATSRWLAVKWRHFQVTSGHIGSRDVLCCHATAISCELKPCRNWNAPKMRVRPSTATSRSLPVKWHHLRATSSHVGSHDVISCQWLPSASYSPVGAETHPKHEFSAFYSHFQVTSGQMTSFQLVSVMWGHMTATSSQLQPCRSGNALKMWVFVFLQPLAGHFQSNDVTSGSLPVTWVHMTLFPAMWLPPPTSYIPVDQDTQNTTFRPSTAFLRPLLVKCCHFWVSSGYFWARGVIFCRMTATLCKLQPWKRCNAPKTRVFGLLQLSGGHFW